MTAARRSGSSRTLRAVAGVLVVLLFLVSGAAAVVWVRGGRVIGRTYTPPAGWELPVPGDSAVLQRGSHIARSIGSCTLCHGEDLGGAVYMDEGALGVIAGPNLTRGRGGVGQHLSDEDWVRAIRYGVGPGGRSLIAMPSEVYVHLSDQDLASLIAYLKQLPPVDRQVPGTKFGWLGRFMVGMGRLNLFSASKTEPLLSVPSVEAGVTPAYGRYLVETAGCAGCHGHGLSGGRVAGPPGLPPASNLTPAGSIRAWSEANFIRAMRKGVRPDGSRIDAFMPWRQLGGMSDQEIRAIWTYLQTVPAKQFGHK